MKQERGDLLAFVHGVINLIWPVFAYDLAELASLIIGGYSWATMVPSTIMLILPIVSDVAGIVVAGVRYYRRQSVLALMGLIFSIAALALYYILRVMMQFSLGWLEPAQNLRFHCGGMWSCRPTDILSLAVAGRGDHTPPSTKHNFRSFYHMKQELIHVGAIVNAHGIRGEVKLNPVGFDPEFLAEFDRFNIGGKETEVRSSRVHKSVLLLTLPGVEDMDAALALKGKSVSIYAEDVELPEGEYFDVELEGCTVLDDATGEELGKLKRVLHYPAHKVYEVKGAREYLIPAVPGVFIASVDIDAGVVRIHNMKGLAIDEN